MKRMTIASLALAFTLASSTFTQTAQPTRRDDPFSSDQTYDRAPPFCYVWPMPGIRSGAVLGVTEQIRFAASSQCGKMTLGVSTAGRSACIRNFVLFKLFVENDGHLA